MKKLASLLLALVMIMSCFSAMASDVGNIETTKGSITINNVVLDDTYSIYRIFDLESYNNTNEAYSYTVNEDWAGFIDQESISGVYVEVENGYVTWVDGASAPDFAALAIKYATDNGIAAVDSAVATDDPLVFSNLALGYYLVDSSVGALCDLTTTKPDATVIEKNSAPELDKQVQEMPDGTWGDENDANIGDTVNFKAIITVQGYAEDYVMHDTMSEGLTFNAVTSVTLNGVTVDPTKYTVDSAPAADDCTFEVIFTEDFCASLKSGDEIIVYYNATLNEKAVVAGDGNPNEAHLSYTDNADSTQNTPPSETITFTWEVPVLKYANNDEAKPLANAKFSLYTDANCTNVISFTTVAVEGQTTVYRVDPEGTVTEIVTDESGKFEIEGLDAGTYYLKETDAPDGYNELETTIAITLDHEGKITIPAATEGGDPQEVTQIGVNNNSGAELPETGGMGTTILYVGGGILVLAAIVLLIAKRRTTAE